MIAQQAKKSVDKRFRSVFGREGSTGSIPTSSSSSDGSDSESSSGSQGPASMTVAHDSDDERSEEDNPATVSGSSARRTVGRRRSFGTCL